MLKQVVEVSTSKTGKHGHAKCHFVAIDIFNAKKLEDIVPSSHNCDVSSFIFDNVSGWTFNTYRISMCFSHFKHHLVYVLLQVPHVTRTDYQLIDISEDGFVCLHIMVYFLVLFFCLSLK